MAGFEITLLNYYNPKLFVFQIIKSLDRSLQTQAIVPGGPGCELSVDLLRCNNSLQQTTAVLQ